jgi:hypothetical protein
VKPQIVIVHLGDQVRLRSERHAAPGKLVDGERDVGTAKMDAALRLQISSVLDFLEQQPNTGAIEECEIAEAKEFSQAQPPRRRLPSGRRH